MIWIPFLAAGVINGIGHCWGYRNFECRRCRDQHRAVGHPDRRRRTAQQPPHYPNSAKFSVKAWEFDLGWVWISLFKLFGLARPLSTGPIVEKVAGKSLIDKDTLWAVLNDRFRVMANYAERVVAPAVEHEVQRADAATRAVLMRAKTLLTREETLVDEAGRNDITRARRRQPGAEDDLRNEAAPAERVGAARRRRRSAVG